MSKRFVDTEIWDKQWFMALSPKLKCFAKYVRDKCDLAGIWYPNYMLAGVYIGEQVTEEELLSIDGGKQFEKINDGKIYCSGFIDFQYGTYLSPQSPVHKKVMDILTKNNIPFETKEAVAHRSSVPTIPEIYEEMIQKTDEYNASIQAERFFSYYDSNGWKVGKNPMKNWKSAVAGWINRSTPEKKIASVEDIKNTIKKQANKKLSEL